jgi:hypothetical protein
MSLLKYKDAPGVLEGSVQPTLLDATEQYCYNDTGGSFMAITITDEQRKRLEQALENHDPKDAARIAEELPEIPPLKEDETVATVIPSRKKAD